MFVGNMNKEEGEYVEDIGILFQSKIYVFQYRSNSISK